MLCSSGTAGGAYSTATNFLASWTKGVTINHYISDDDLCAKGRTVCQMIGGEAVNAADEPYEPRDDDDDDQFTYSLHSHHTALTSAPPILKPEVFGPNVFALVIRRCLAHTISSAGNLQCL